MKITGICGIIMIAFVVSSLSTATEISLTGPHTCENFSDPNAVCEVTHNGWSRDIHCLHGFIYVTDLDKCIQRELPKANDRGPQTCIGSPAVNAVCEVTDNGWGKNILCFDGYIYARDLDECLPKRHAEAHPRSRETCEYFSDVNGVCRVKTDGSGKYIHCRPGYVQPLGSDQCISKATVRGSRTCDGFSAANAVCEIVDNAWALNVRCLDGYIHTPHSNNCVRKKSANTARQSASNANV